jgi:two-component system LytT family sensor kinase
MRYIFVMQDEPLAASEPAGTPPRVTWRLALISIVGFWLLYFFVNSIHMSIERGGMQWGMMARRTFVSLTGMALTFVLCLILRRLEGRSMHRMVTTVFVAAVPVSFAYASVNFAAFYLIYPGDHMADDLDWQSSTIPPALALIIGTAVSWYFFIVAWGALYVALAYAARVGAAERRAAAYRAAAQNAQLRALRYQINPHFLFNTLNSLSTLILRAAQRRGRERMIINLAGFFRTSLTGDPAEDVTLADEIRCSASISISSRAASPTVCWW